MSTIAAQMPLFELDDRPIGPARLGRQEISEIYVKQILAKPTGSLKSFDYTLNPYIGCGFGCSYCYASFFQADESKFHAWGTWVSIKKNAETLLRQKHGLKGALIFMSSATDPYQPLEGKVGLTRRLLEIMSEPGRQPKLLVQTRGPLVTRDIDVLKRYSFLRVNMSITTDSDAIRKEFEPGCASIERRMEAIREAKMAGLHTGVCLCPLLPVEDPERFARKLAELKADSYTTGFFHDTDRPFAANTRDRAWELARGQEWDKRAYHKTVEEIARYFPQLNVRNPFRPV
jgi:DNA repair photolyase